MRQIQNSYKKIRIRIIIFLVLSIIAQGIFAQREDATWLLGESLSATTDTNYGRIHVSFTDTSIVLKKTYNVKHKMDYTHASICDSSGNLLIYSNGLEIYDRLYRIMPNGDDINTSFTAIRNEDIGYATMGAMIILPFPGEKNKIICIHNISYRVPLPTPVWEWYSLDLLTTLVDMDLNNKMGDVVYKNKSVFSDTTVDGTLSACRHANGRDWWVNVLRFDGSKMYSFLLDPNGLNLYKVYPLDRTIVKSNNGQAVYNPQGTKFAMFMANDSNFKEMVLCDFNRCTGAISNVQYGRDTLFESRGAAFSPNGRFLYLATGSKLYQLDMEDAEPYLTKTLIDTMDRFKTSPWSYAHLANMQLAPNGKIYITAERSSRHLGVIEYPDIKGKGCKLVQHKIDLGMYSTSLPNVPYFRLGAERGTVCDSLGQTVGIDQNRNQNESYEKIKLYPNPSYGEIHIEIPDGKMSDRYEVKIIDITGKVYYHKEMKLMSDEITIYPKLSDGIYFIKILKSDFQITNTKFVFKN